MIRMPSRRSSCVSKLCACNPQRARCCGSGLLRYLTVCATECYRWSVLVEARKQLVAWAGVPRVFRRPMRKVQRNFPPKPPSAVPPWRLGGPVKTGPLSSRHRRDGALSRSRHPVFSRVLLPSLCFPSYPGKVGQASACRCSSYWLERMCVGKGLAPIYALA